MTNKLGKQTWKIIIIFNYIFHIYTDFMVINVYLTKNYSILNYI